MPFGICQRVLYESVIKAIDDGMGIKEVKIIQTVLPYISDVLH